MATETIEKPHSADVTRQERTRCGLVYRPNVDILESADELTVRADMPGVSGEDVDVQFENGTLTLHGRVQPRERKNVFHKVTFPGLRR